MLQEKRLEWRAKYPVLELFFCISFIVIFFVTHHYITNIILDVNDLNYRVFANSLQFTLALFLFRYWFKSRKLRLVGSVLFCVEILTTCIAVYIASINSARDKLFPEFIPLYLIINSILIFHILWARQVRIVLILPLLIAAGAYDIAIAPRLLKKSWEDAGNIFIGKKIRPFLSRSTCDTHLIVRQLKSCLVFATFQHCLPCRKMKPFEEDASIKFKSAAVEVIKLDLIDDWAEIISTANAEHNKGHICTIAPFADTTVKTALDTYGFPLILVINRDGEIIYAHAGYDTHEYNLLMKELGNIIMHIP